MRRADHSALLVTAAGLGLLTWWCLRRRPTGELGMLADAETSEPVRDRDGRVVLIDDAGQLFTASLAGVEYRGTYEDSGLAGFGKVFKKIKKVVKKSAVALVLPQYALAKKAVQLVVPKKVAKKIDRAEDVAKPYALILGATAATIATGGAAAPSLIAAGSAAVGQAGADIAAKRQADADRDFRRQQAALDAQAEAEQAELDAQADAAAADGGDGDGDQGAQASAPAQARGRWFDWFFS